MSVSIKVLVREWLTARQLSPERLYLAQRQLTVHYPDGTGKAFEFDCDAQRIYVYTSLTNRDGTRGRYLPVRSYPRIRRHPIG